MLEVVGACVEDLSPVASIPKLRYLNLNSNQITSVAPLRSMENLLAVDLGFNPVLDWDSIADNAALTAAFDWDFSLALAVEARAKALVAETVTDGMTDLEKQVAIYKKVHEIADCEEVMRPMQPDGYQVLLCGRGVCGDFAQATAILMNLAGLRVYLVGSDVHEWNMIELDGVWYEFDCMWDDGAEAQDWLYFNRSHTAMSADVSHRSDPYRYPFAPRNMLPAEYLPAD